MEDKKEFTVFIASPSDLQAERKEICNYINTLHIKEWRFTVNMWENKLHSTTIDYEKKGVQGIIDEELLDSSDIVIGIFKLKFGEKTAEHESATVGEIEESIAKHKPVSLYFWNSDKLANELTKEELEGLTKIKEFKKKYEDKGIYKEVKNLQEIKDNIKCDLEYNVGKILEKENISNTDKKGNNKNNNLKKVSDNQHNGKKQNIRTNSTKNRGKGRKTNAWYKMSITDFINEHLEKKQFDFKYQDNLTFRENLKLSLEYFNYMESTVEQILNESRIYAFNQKYGQYDYQYDLRSKYENWSSDIIKIL